MHVVIIGNGVTGVSAALELRERDSECRITMISGESKYHYSRPALMYIFMGHMRYEDTKPFEDRHWDDKRIDLVRGWVTGIDTERQRLALHEQDPIEYDALVLATGAKPNKFGWPGQDLDGVQGLWGLPDLAKLYKTVERTRRAVIVGGGLIGIELAEMMHSHGVDVTFLVREKSYWNRVLPNEESSMINEIIAEAGLDLRLGVELQEIVDDGQGRCGGVITKSGETIDCELVGLTAGVSPNIDLAKESAIETGRGILVDRRLGTNVENVYAAGDCAEIVEPGDGRNTIEQVWYTGKMQGEFVAKVITGNVSDDYDSGIWFNSAKFLDLEYHTYGQVHRNVEGEQSLYWEADDRRKAVRIIHVDGRAIGFNLMGIRWRHEVCQRWLAENATVDHVLANLQEPFFDPEFYRN
ncbi:MAG: FAD/NAD(P)-binding oxidoreductase, partial [Planctomycetota bacterium]